VATEVAKRLPERVREHNLTLVSAGVAFYAFLAFIPTLIAVVSIYGLVANPDDIARQVESFAGALPDEVQRFIEFQLRSIAESSSGTVSVTLVIAIALALWSASGGMAALVTGLHVTHDQDEPKSFVKKRGKALLLTVGAVVMLGIVIFLVAALPAVVGDLGSGARAAFGILRWPLLGIVMVGGLGLLYRLALPEARPGWLGVVTVGTIVAALMWLAVSALFAIYTASFATYSETYGSLASIVVVLLWLFLSVLAILVGAEVDAAR
jgi:membrane protein